MLLLAGALLTTLTFGSDSQTPQGLYGGLARLFVVGSTALSKTSYGLTLWRLIDAQNTVSGHRKLWWLIFLILLGVNLTTWAPAVFPLVECYIGPSSEPRTCWTSEADVIIVMAGSGCSGAMNVVLALLPLATIYKYKTHVSRTLVLFAMVMGVMAAVAAFTQCSQIPDGSVTTFASACESSHPSPGLCIEQTLILST